ncbi:MAG: hypothetical protein IJQ24_12875 [Synergistaceae bacterium]|nr:hypothetical protein [Synergistaceae bacterium]
MTVATSNWASVALSFESTQITPAFAAVVKRDSNNADDNSFFMNMTD